MCFDNLAWELVSKNFAQLYLSEHENDLSEMMVKIAIGSKLFANIKGRIGL